MVIHLKDSNTFVTSPEAVAKILQDLLKAEDPIDQDKEHFWVIHLDSRLKIKFVELISLGTLNASLVHPREVYTRAVSERSAQILVAHNHPSGDSEPSAEDIAMTRRLWDGGRLLGIELVDHIVITSTGFTSFKEKKLI